MTYGRTYIKIIVREAIEMFHVYIVFKKFKTIVKVLTNIMQQFTTQMLNHNPEDYTEEFRLKKYYIISSIINLFNLNNRKKDFGREATVYVRILLQLLL